VPRWLAKLITAEFGGAAPADMKYRFTDAAGGVATRSFKSRQAEVVVRRVCVACNGGWMARLEQVTKPVLEPMVLGRTTRLTIDQQVLLAHWAAKTVVVIKEFESHAVVFDEGDRAAVLNGQAPMGLHVRLGYRPQFDEAMDLLLTTAHVIPAEEAISARSAGARYRTGPANSFLATLAFGGVVIAVAGGPGFRRDERWVDGGVLPLTIWPPTLGGLSWPPRHPIITSKAELHTFHDQMYIHVRNPELAERLLDQHETESAIRGLEPQ
jgi:hypothetical protein